MTRYTNLGRKRTYIEAGFNEDNAEKAEEQRGTKLSTPEESVAAAVDAPPAKKKRKRSKKKKRKENGETNFGDNGEKTEVTEADAAEGTTRAGNPKKSKAKKVRKDGRPRLTPSEQRRQKRIQEKLASTTCFACREKGHAAKDCPNVKPGEQDENANAKGKVKNFVGICYRCGSKLHTLSRCKKPENPENPLPYASCFVCSGIGHLASNCPQNKDKGVYPNGGCCKLCGETSHLARDCGLRKQTPSTVVLAGTGKDVGADEDDFHAFKRKAIEVEKEEHDEVRAKKDVRAFVKTSIAPVLKKKVVVF